MVYIEGELNAQTLKHNSIRLSNSIYALSTYASYKMLYVFPDNSTIAHK